MCGHGDPNRCKHKFSKFEEEKSSFEQTYFGWKMVHKLNWFQEVLFSLFSINFKLLIVDQCFSLLENCMHKTKDMISWLSRYLYNKICFSLIQNSEEFYIHDLILALIIFSLSKIRIILKK